MSDTGALERKGRQFGPIMAWAFSIANVILPCRRFRFKQILEDLHLTDGCRVLDVGCGPGNLVFLIAKKFPRSTVIGIDPSPDMVKTATKRIAKLETHNTVQVLVGDCKNVPVPGKFDLIVSSSSYHHWEDKSGGLKNLANLLNDGGSLNIYESYYGESSGGTRSTETHSLSSDEANAMVVNGFEKSVLVTGKLIAVKFRGMLTRQKPI